MAESDFSKFHKIFLEEISELLESLNDNLLHLESSPEDEDIINEIFRLTHSIKSESSLVGFNRISSVAHKMEDIFEKVRRGLMRVDVKSMNILLAAFDKIVEIVAGIQQGKSEENFKIDHVIKELKKILTDKSDQEKPVEIEDKKKEEKRSLIKKALEEESKQDEVQVKEGELNRLDFTFTNTEISHIEDGLEKGDKFYQIVFYLTKDCDMRYPRAYLVYNNLMSIGTVVKTIPDILLETDEAKYNRIEMLILSGQDTAKIAKSADVDQVSRIEINKINLKAIKDKGIELSGLANEPDFSVPSSEMYDQKNNLLNSEKDNSSIKPSLSSKTENDESGLKSESMASDHLIKKQTIRVDVDRLDMLMNLVGELIITHSRYNQLKQRLSQYEVTQDLKSDLEDATNEFERILDLMQSGMMQVRMVPIGTVFSKFPRMVRDLSNSLKKNVKLIISGENTEIDRAIVELITEPLTHLIRNSIDHGLEMPDERTKIGKNREGSIDLKAYQRGSNIYIEVNDDGKGMNAEVIKEKAIEQKIITAQQAVNLTNDEVINLIFEPGFSTKEEITNISGRGVGMDVVKNQIKKLRGTVDIETYLERGTNITIILPLTLTIVEALLVNVGNGIFAIPIDIIEETMIINKKDIKDFDDYQVYSLRDETIAVNYLADLVGLPNNTKDNFFLVVVSYEKRKVAIAVDELIGNQDIVIKALDESFRNLEGITGATVLGDGKIAIIIDVSSLVKAKKREKNKEKENFEFFGRDKYNFDRIYDQLNPNDKTDNNRNKKTPDDLITSNK